MALAVTRPRLVSRRLQRLSCSGSASSRSVVGRASAFSVIRVSGTGSGASHASSVSSSSASGDAVCSWSKATAHDAVSDDG